jgi:hypothetical protein
VTDYSMRVILPDTWTLGHWLKFQSARSEFIERMERSKQFVAAVEADFRGAMALYRAGYIKFENAPEEFLNWLSKDDLSDMPLSFLGFMRDNVIMPMLQAIDSPLGIMPSTSKSE